MIPQKKQLRKGYLKIEHICIGTFCLLLLLGCNRLFQKEYYEMQITRSNLYVLEDTIYIKDKVIINSIVNVLEESKSEDVLKLGATLQIRLLSKEGFEKVYINGSVFQIGSKYYSSKHNVERFIEAQLLR